ncbi:MAG: YggT family protein [Gammaproteobacteria bacterium]|nr:YggT family protein [Gammaproteobacteria bacterium]
MQSITSLFLSQSLSGLYFFIVMLLNLYLFVVALRLILQWNHANFFNPISQIISKLTSMPLHFFKKALPFSHRPAIDTALFLWLLELFKFISIFLFVRGTFPSMVGLLISSIAESADLILSILFYCLFVFVILSWFSAFINKSLLYFLFQIADPLMGPARRLLPSIAGLDFSPVLVLILLRLTQAVITKPLLSVGYQLAG